MGVVIRLEMPDGTEWDIPAEVVAKARADYYARVDEREGDGTYEDSYAKELEYTMDADDELIDWIGNNMYWRDLEPHATKVDQSPPALPDYHKLFDEAEARVIRN